MYDGSNAKEDPLSGKPLRADFLSPMEDLAFDMYQDPEIASLCRKLDRKKQDAVLRTWPREEGRVSVGIKI